jgi:hypothetical protein
MKASKLICVGLINLIALTHSEKHLFAINYIDVDTIKTFCFEPVSKDVYLSAQKTYVEKLIQDTTCFIKQNEQLKLPLYSRINEYRIFQDNYKGDEDENKCIFNYLGQFNQIDYYVVSVTYWEHYEVLLVDKLSGDHYVIWSVPKISPDNNLIATILPFGLEGEPVGIQVLYVNKFDDNHIQKIIEINQQLWNPIDIIWESNNSIILKVNKMTDYCKSGKEVDFSYMRLKFY